MLEDYLSTMTTPILASNLLVKVIDDYIMMDNVTILHESKDEKDKNVSALLYVLSLIQNDIKNLQQKCYVGFIKAKK